MSAPRRTRYGGALIYLDHNATTPVLPEVFEAMRPFFCEQWGNPSSTYRFGAQLKSVIETAREQVAGLIGAHPLEIVFTSGGTESDNTKYCIRGTLRGPNGRELRVISFWLTVEATGIT